MTIAQRVQSYLAGRGIAFDVVAHPRSQCSMETAERAHIPGNRLAKSVVLRDDNGFLMAVLPSTCHVQLGELSKALQRTLRLATEKDLPGVLADCELGAVPPIGAAYGLAAVVDDSLMEEPEIYFEAGDHEQLIRVKREDFVALMNDAGHARFAVRM